MTARNALLAGSLSVLGSIPLLIAAQTSGFQPWKLSAPAPVADERPAELEGWREVSCARCHARIAAEWASSRHASAWVGARYREELLEKSRPESCHGCHAPEPLFLADATGTPPRKPKPRSLEPKSGADRDLDAHFGVTCATCHLGRDGAMLGPFGAKTDAHPSTRHALFTSGARIESAGAAPGGPPREPEAVGKPEPMGQNDLCIACHATTVGPVIGIATDFVDTDQAARGKSCVGCHMQPVELPIAAQEGQGPFAVRAGRSHALQTPRDPAFLRRAFALRAEEREGSVVVVVENTCGHRVPGLIGREITLAFELVDATGAGGAKGSIAFDTRSCLHADARVEVSIPGRGTHVKIRGQHDAPGFAERVLFLDETIAVGK